MGQWRAKTSMNLFSSVKRQQTFKSELGGCSKSPFLSCTFSCCVLHIRWYRKKRKKIMWNKQPRGGRFQLLTQQCSAHQLKARTQPLTRFASGWTISPARRGARTTGHGRTTGPSVSPVIWATVQPGRNHGKGPGKRWVYCPSILPPVTDAHCLTRGLVFWIFWEHPQIRKYSVTLLEQHKRNEIVWVRISR